MTHPEYHKIQTSDHDGDSVDQVGRIPAIFVDGWNAIRFCGHMRITFAETVGEKAHVRNAIVLTLEDAERLARSILEMIEASVDS